MKCEFVNSKLWNYIFQDKFIFYSLVDKLMVSGVEATKSFAELTFCFELGSLIFLNKVFFIFLIFNFMTCNKAPNFKISPTLVEKRGKENNSLEEKKLFKRNENSCACK